MQQIGGCKSLFVDASSSPTDLLQRSMPCCVCQDGMLHCFTSAQPPAPQLNLHPRDPTLPPCSRRRHAALTSAPACSAWSRRRSACPRCLPTCLTMRCWRICSAGSTRWRAALPMWQPHSRWAGGQADVTAEPAALMMLQLFGLRACK